jgi:hypothetical protein
LFGPPGRGFPTRQAECSGIQECALTEIDAYRGHVLLAESGVDRVDSGVEVDRCLRHRLVRATQFYEFVRGIADSATEDDTVRVSSALIQPMAADDVATAVARTAVGQPVGGILEVAGPDRYPLDELVRTRLRASGDTRRVVTDLQARYFGVLEDHTLVPGTDATVFSTRFTHWLIDNAPAPAR